MKFLKETFIGIICLLALAYVLFSFGNGSFNFAEWDAKARLALALSGFAISGVVIMIQAVRYM